MNVFFPRLQGGLIILTSAGALYAWWMRQRNPSVGFIKSPSKTSAFEENAASSITSDSDKEDVEELQCSPKAQSICSAEEEEILLTVTARPAEARNIYPEWDYESCFEPPTMSVHAPISHAHYSSNSSIRTHKTDRAPDKTLATYSQRHTNLNSTLPRDNACWEHTARETTADWVAVNDLLSRDFLTFSSSTDNGRRLCLAGSVQLLPHRLISSHSPLQSSLSDYLKRAAHLPLLGRPGLLEPHDTCADVGNNSLTSPIDESSERAACVDAALLHSNSRALWDWQRSFRIVGVVEGHVLPIKQDAEMTTTSDLGDTMAEISANRTEADGCSSGSSSSSSVRVAYLTADEEGVNTAQPTVNLASWQQASNDRYSSMASMLDEVKRDINNLSERLRKSPYINEDMETEVQQEHIQSSPVNESPSSDEIAHSVRQSLADMGRRLREAGESPTLEMDLQMDSFPSPVSPRVVQLDNRSEDELFLNPFQQEFIQAAPQKTWRCPSDVSSTIAGDLAMSGDYAEFSDRTRMMLQRIRRERHEERPASPPGSPTFEPIECEGINIEDFILDTFLEEVESAHHRYRSLPTILEERPEDLPPSSSSSSFSDESDEEIPHVIEMQTLGSSEDMTTNLDDSPRGHAAFMYGQSGATSNLAFMVEQDAAQDPGYMDPDDEASTSYFSAATGSDSETFVTVTDDDEEPKKLPCGTLLYAKPSQAILDATGSPYDCCESSSDSDDEGDRTLGRGSKMWSPEDQRQAPDGSTTEEVAEKLQTAEVEEEVMEATRTRGFATTPPPAEESSVIEAVQEKSERPPIVIPTPHHESEVKEAPKMSTFTVIDSRKRIHPPDSPTKQEPSTPRRTKIDSDQNHIEDDKRLSVESFDSISDQSTLSEIIVDTGEAPSDYSTETATETDSSDSRSESGDFVTDMYHGRRSPNHYGFPDEGKRKHFKPTLPPANVYKPPLSKRPKMSSITESRSSDEEATSDDNSERQIIDYQSTPAVIGRDESDANDVSITKHVSERVEHESSANAGEYSTGTPNDSTLSGLAGAVCSDHEEIPTSTSAKVTRESDVTLSRSSSAGDFEDAMEDLSIAQRTEVNQEVIPTTEMASANRKGPVVAVASSRALVKRGANFTEAPETKPVISTEVKAEATGASASIAAARATAKAASIATANASPHSPTSEDLHIYISTSCTIRNQAALQPDNVSMALSRRPPASDSVVTDAHQLPRPPIKDSTEQGERENIFSWLNSGKPVSTTTHELPSPNAEGDKRNDMHTLESAAFQVLEQHTGDPGEARRLAGDVVKEVQHDRDLSTSIYCPRPFTRNERYSEVRKSLENLQQNRQRPKPAAPSTLLRADIRAHAIDPRTGSRFVEMSDVSVRKIPQSAPIGKVESTFISDSSGSSSPDDRSNASKFASERYRIRPEYKSVLQKPVDQSDNGTNSYTRSGLATSPTVPIKGNEMTQRHEKQRNDFFSPHKTERATPVEMKLAAALKSDVNTPSRPTTVTNGRSVPRLREVVDDETVYHQDQHQRRRRRSCRTTDIDTAIRSSTKDLTDIDGYDELDTAPGKFFSVSLYDLNAAAGSVFSPPPEDNHNPAKTFFAATAKSLTSLLQTDIDTGMNNEEPLVIETDVDSIAPSPLPSKTRSMVDLMARSPLMSPIPLQTYDVDLHLNRTQSMMLPQTLEAKQQPSMTLRERLEKKAKSQTELRIAKSLTKLNVPHWLDNVPLRDDARSRPTSTKVSERPARSHSASSTTSPRRPVVIETRVTTPHHSLYSQPTSNEAAPTTKFELPSQKFRNSFNEKLQPIRSKLRDSLPNLYTNKDEEGTAETNTFPRKTTPLKTEAPLVPIRLDATDFAPKRTVRQVKREKTVETRTVQRSEIVAQGSLTDVQNGSVDGGQSSPDSGYIGSRTWPQTTNLDLESPHRSVKVTETTVVETSVRQGDDIIESDHYKTSTHEEWTDSNQGDAMRDFIQRQFDLLPSLGASERTEDREYVHAVSETIRYFGLTDEKPPGDDRVKLDEDDVLSAFFEPKQRGTDISALIAGEENSNPGPSLLHAGIVSDQGRHYLQCVREQCHQKRLLITARKTYTSCPACFTYYCSELCANWDRNGHMAHCACSRLTNTCQKIIRCIHTNSDHRRPLARMANAGLAAFGRGFVLLSFNDLKDAIQFLKDTDNDLRSAPCYIAVNDSNMPDVFGKSVESMRTACSDYDTSHQFVIVVSIANRTTGRTVKKSATLPIGGDDNETIVLHSADVVTSVPVTSIPVINGQKTINGDVPGNSDDDTVDSSEDSETSDSESETESESEEDRLRQNQKQKEVLMKRQEEMKRKAEGDARKRAEEARRKREDDERKEKEAKKKKEEDARRKQEEARRKKEEEARKKAKENKKKEEEARKKREDETRRKQEVEARKQEEARRKQEEEARRKQEEEARRKQEEEARRKQEEEARRKQEEETRRKQEEEARRKQEGGFRLKKAMKAKQEDMSDSETESSSEYESGSETDSSESPAPVVPPRPTLVNNRPFPLPAPSRPPPRPPVQAPIPAVRPQYPPPPRPMPRASVPTNPRTVALANSQSPSGSISSLGSNPDGRLSQQRSSISSIGSNSRQFGSVSSLTQESSPSSLLDLPARQSLLALTERKMMAHGVDLRVSFRELFSQLVRFTEDKVIFPRRTIYPTDSRTGRRLACTFICGREPIIQFVPLSTSRTSTPNLSPRSGSGVDANFNIPPKSAKPTIETEL